MRKKLKIFLTDKQLETLDKYDKIQRQSLTPKLWLYGQMRQGILTIRENWKTWLVQGELTEEQVEAEKPNYDPDFKKEGQSITIRVVGDLLCEGLDLWMKVQNAKNRKEKKKIYKSFEEMYHDYLLIVFSHMEDTLYEIQLNKEIHESKATDEDLKNSK